MMSDETRQYDYGVAIGHTDGFQACYEVMRGDPCWYCSRCEPICYHGATHTPCAEHYTDCPLHKEKV